MKVTSLKEELLKFHEYAKEGDEEKAKLLE